MNALGKNVGLYVISLCIVLASFAVMILDFAIPLNLWYHPVLNFIFCLFIGFGVFCVTLGVIKKSPWYFFLSAGQLVLALIYLLVFYKVNPLITVVSAIVLAAVVCLSSLIVCGNKTEDIALNKSDDYKNYEQRRAEKEKAEAEKEPEKLPEIKSFKD